MRKKRKRSPRWTRGLPGSGSRPLPLSLRSVPMFWLHPSMRPRASGVFLNREYCCTVEDEVADTFVIALRFIGKFAVGRAFRVG